MARRRESTQDIYFRNGLSNLISGKICKYCLLKIQNFNEEFYAAKNTIAICHQCNLNGEIVYICKIHGKKCKKCNQYYCLMHYSLGNHKSCGKKRIL